ncbi:MAG: DUF1315 family protein [Pseudomonadales bacterium]
MTYEELIEKMTPQMHGAIKRAIELSKWPDGKRMTAEQLEICMRAIITYEQRLPEEARTGYIDRRRSDGSVKGQDPLAPQVLNIVDSSTH